MEFKIIRTLIMMVIMSVVISFFVKMSHREIKRICPQGSHSALGGQHNRNFWTLNTDILIITIWAIVVPFNVVISAQNEAISKLIGPVGLFFLTQSIFLTYETICYLIIPGWLLLRSRKSYFALWADNHEIVASNESDIVRCPKFEFKIHNTREFVYF